MFYYLIQFLYNCAICSPQIPISSWRSNQVIQREFIALVCNLWEKVFLLGDITLGWECQTKQEGQGMLCLLDIKRKSIQNVSLAAGVTSKEGKPRGSYGNMSYAGKAPTRKPSHSMGWLRNESENRQDFSCPLSGWVCRLFPYPAKTSAVFL